MSKKKKKNTQRKKRDARKTVLKDMLACNDACGDLGNFKVKEFDTMYDRVEFCVANLPSFPFAENQFINYMFSDGLVAGGVQENEILDAFRFRVNDQNMTNNSVLRDAIKYAHCRYGECGIRWKDGNIYLYKSGSYAPLTLTEDGIEQIVAYIATKDGSMITDRQIELKDLRFIAPNLEMDVINRYFDEQGLILLDKSEFVSIRNDTSKLFGESPLERDKLRVDLLVSVYDRHQL